MPSRRRAPAPNVPGAHVAMTPVWPATKAAIVERRVVDVDGRQEMVVRLEVGDGRVVQDEAGRTALQYVVALLDARVGATLADHDVTGEGARVSGIDAQLIAVRCVAGQHDRGRAC